MRDPFTWSFPIGRLFGITIRVHILLIVVFLGVYLRVVGAKEGFPPGTGVDTLILLGLLFVSVLLHEFGHCYGAHLVEGEAQEILLWPLGGLAFCDVPHTPRANFITVLMGPMVNLFLCLVAGVVLLSVSLVPPLVPWSWNFFNAPLFNWEHSKTFLNPKYGVGDGLPLEWWQLLAGRVFFLNWCMFLLNLLPAYPLDGGRLLQTSLWPRLGYRRSTLVAVFAGFVCMFLIGIVSIAANEVLALALALFIFFSCRQQWLLLETGGEEGLFGYDFSQGYTSLERDQPAAPVKTKRPNFFQRWLQRRAARKLQRELEQREADERRMDQLLEKIQRQGRQSLTDEENRFLKRVADRYRNRS